MKDFLRATGAQLLGLILVISVLVGMAYLGHVQQRQAIVDRCPAGKDLALCFKEADAGEAAAARQRAKETAADREKLEQTIAMPYAKLTIRNKVLKAVDSELFLLILAALLVPLPLCQLWRMADRTRT